MGLAKLMGMVVASPDPFGLRVVQVLNLLAVLRAVNAERRGENMRYSKFAPTGGAVKGRTLSSKTGMAIIYSPAAILCSSFVFTNLFSTRAPEHRLIVFSAALAAHFVKRLLEVFFVHKYSGAMEMSVSFTISFFYALSSIQLLYAQNVSVQQQPPAVNLRGWGMLLFVVGMTGNLYHHYLLAKLRTDIKKEEEDGKKQYATPQGGLFTWLVCPHYLFECIDFLGLALIGQTTTAFVHAFFTFLMLGARSRSTKRWYEMKIEGFPKERKAFLPFLF